MLDMLVKLNMNVIVAHLNHQLRDTAVRDADFVRMLAERYSLECISGKIDVRGSIEESGEGVEEAARNARYKFLFRIAEEKKAAAVLTAHQADDQVETILLNILRGSGLKGLAGMQPCSISAYHAEIPLIRPLLDCSREEILEYCSQENLGYMTDETNVDTTYRRNSIRLELIPNLQTYNPQIKKTLLRMGKILKTDKDFMDGYINAIIKSSGITLKDHYAEMDIHAFIQQPLAVRRVLVKYILGKCFPDEDSLGFSQYEDACRFVAREIKSTGMQLNDHIALRLERDQVVFMRTEAMLQPSTDWPSIGQMVHVKAGAGEIELGLGWKAILTLHPVEEIGRTYLENPDPYRVYLDEDSLEGELEIRKWQAGDRFQPLGMDGKSIKLSDFWTNKKVPGRAKQHWPLFLDACDVIWIPGFQPSERSKITAKTRRILIIHVYRQ